MLVAIDDSQIYQLIGVGILLGSMIGSVVFNKYIRVSLYRRLGMRRSMLRLHTITKDVRTLVVADDAIMVKVGGKELVLPRDRPCEREGNVPVFDFYETDAESGHFLELNMQVKEPRDPDLISSALAMQLAALTVGFFNKRANWILLLGIGLVILGVGSAFFSYTSMQGVADTNNKLMIVAHYLNMTK